MPNLLIFLISFTFISIPSLSQLNEFVYTGFNQPNTNITLMGSSKINQNGALQLTNTTRRLTGHAFYPTPLKFKSSPNDTVFSFSTAIAFGIIPEYPKLGGHGLAFTISPSKNFIKYALPSQYLGLFNATNVGNFTDHLVAIEFDTVRDFEFGDIDDNHVGIDINSLVSNKSSKADLNLKSGKTIIAWIEYDSSTNLINVTISQTSSKPKFPILSFHLNLSPILQQNMYVGFSASTGLLASSHYILGWSFCMNGKSKFLDLDSLPSLHKKKNMSVIIGMSILSFFVTVSLFLVVIYVARRKKGDVVESWELELGPHRYSYQELKKATKGFKESELLGIGGFGKVYKGILSDSKTQIAVKRISHGSRQGLKEFVSEIASIGRLRHRNLVQLLGWCRRLGDLLLVYEFMPNGSLDNLLFENSKVVLSWEQRFNVIKGVASGLLYLHEGYEQIVIHRDIKASNVLLDGEMNGRLGDFGLARLYEHGVNPGTTRVVGTLGYLAPELSRTGRVTKGSDVFAFGALILEVVCGRRPVMGDMVLVDWVREKWRDGKVGEVVDEKLDGGFDEREMMVMVKLGLMCLNNKVVERPSMRQVVRCLEAEGIVPEVGRGPDYGGYNGGFDDYVNSLASSSFERSDFFRGGDGSTSPFSLLYHKGEAR